MPRRTSYCQFFNINTISSMTTYTKSKCKVVFAQCSGNSVISSRTICITLLESEDVPTVRSISISQILVLPDITDVKMLSVSQLLLCPCTSVPTLHHGFTHASHLFNRAYRTSHGYYLGFHGIAITESRPWSQNRAKGRARGVVLFPQELCWMSSHGCQPSRILLEAPTLCLEPPAQWKLGKISCIVILHFAFVWQLSSFNLAL